MMRLIVLKKLEVGSKDTRVRQEMLKMTRVSIFDAISGSEVRIHRCRKFLGQCNSRNAESAIETTLIFSPSWSTLPSAHPGNACLHRDFITGLSPLKHTRDMFMSLQADGVGLVGAHRAEDERRQARSSGIM